MTVINSETQSACMLKLHKLAGERKSGHSDLQSIDCPYQ
jgi:hypothetical protein